MSRSDVVPDCGEIDDVVALARRVGGLPLALELAAARSATMAIPDVLARIDRSPRFLRGDDPTADARQATIEGALGWSWDLLSDAERSTLRRITVIEGPITLELAEAVAGHGDVEDWEVADHLDALVRHSLLAVHAGDVTSYWFHPLVREFAAERIAAGGDDVDVLLDRRDAWILRLIDRHREALEGVRPDAAQRVIDRHDADLRAAAARFATSDPASAVACIEARFWCRTGGSEALLESIDLAAADPVTREYVELGRRSGAMLDALGFEHDDDLLRIADRYDEIGRPAAAALCRCGREFRGAAIPGAEVDEAAARAALDLLAGHRLWLLAAGRVTSVVGVVSEDLRDHVLTGLMEVSQGSTLAARTIDPLSGAAPPPGHRALVRALLAAQHEQPLEIPGDGFASGGLSYAFAGALVDLLVEQARWTDLAAVLRSSDRSYGPAIWAMGCAHLALVGGHQEVASALHRRTVGITSLRRSELDPVFRRMFGRLDEPVADLPGDLPDPLTRDADSTPHGYRAAVEQAVELVCGPSSTAGLPATPREQGRPLR